MYKTVDELLQLIHDAVHQEEESLGKSGTLRRLARFRQAIGSTGQVKVHLPKPAMSEEGRAVLKNSRRASTRRSSQDARVDVGETKRAVTVVADKTEEKEN
jgi:hypothetical protein